MPETCTCGTTLVENARFCHRCGKPTFEPVSTFEDLPPAVETPQRRMSGAIPISALPVGFRNPVALRVAFLMSVGIMLLEMIPVVNVLFVLWWLAAGWGGVRLYRRLTGLTLSVKEGARLGSITGVLTFLSFTIIFAFLILVSGKETFDQVAKTNPQIAPVLNDPVQLAAGVLMFLCLVFAMVVGICAAGGALGAKFTGQIGPRSSTVG
jgi:hypothetical protein